MVTIVAIYKFHALTNRNKEKTMQWSYNTIVSKLHYDSVTLCKQALSNSFYLTSLLVF